MRQIIAVANQKGGVGKTTTAINLGACMALGELRVLIVDIDPQGNATSGIGLLKDEQKKTVYDVLINGDSVEDTVVKTGIDNLYILPANIQLAGAELELVSEFSRETRLKEALEHVNDKFDVVIIDCPPSLGLLTINALTAADSLLVPIQCEFFAMEGISQLLRTLGLVRKNLNKKLEIGGILLTMFDRRINLANQVVGEIRSHFKEKVFKTIIPRNVALSEAPSHGLPIVIHKTKSRGAEAYTQLAKEVINSVKESSR